MRSILTVFLASIILANPSTSAKASSIDPSCSARVDRVGHASVHWITAWEDDVDRLDRWCRGVGPPLYVPAPAIVSSASPPDLADLVVITWNAHLAEGRLEELVERLRAGSLTGGRSVKHFVLLAQEVVRRGDAVPAFGIRARAARAIRARVKEAPDAGDSAARLGLATLYVPSMRNGPELFEDRGNAIFSSEPLSQALAFELPLERQRSVAVGAAIDVVHAGRRSTLRVIGVHLEPLSSPQSLWVFGNPRRRQVAALLGLLSASRFEDDVAWVGTVLAGDFNTVKRGDDESAYRHARAWSTGLVEEDPRATHFLGRLDYLFFRLAEGIAATTTRANHKFGSDHHPIVGRFTSERTNEGHR